MSWILNPYGIDLGAYVLLWGVLLALLPVALVVGVVKAMRQRRRHQPNDTHKTPLTVKGLLEHE